MKTEFDIHNNKEALRFEYSEDKEKAFLEYRYYKKDIAFMHTVVPEALGGKGVGSALAKSAFAFAKKENKGVMVYCPFVSKFLLKHPEFKEQLSKEYYPK